MSYTTIRCLSIQGTGNAVMCGTSVIMLSHHIYSDICPLQHSQYYTMCTLHTHIHTIHTHTNNYIHPVETSQRMRNVRRVIYTKRGTGIYRSYQVSSIPYMGILYRYIIVLVRSTIHLRRMSYSLKDCRLSYLRSSRISSALFASLFATYTKYHRSLYITVLYVLWEKVLCYRVYLVIVHIYLYLRCVYIA